MSKRIERRPQMYQKEFVRQVAETAMIPEYEAAELIEAVLHTIVSILLDNQSVCFPEFGVFELRESKQRMGRNPKTMEEFVIPESLKLVFRPAKALRDAVSEYAARQKWAEDSDKPPDCADASGLAVDPDSSPDS